MHGMMSYLSLKIVPSACCCPVTPVYVVDHVFLNDTSSARVVVILIAS